MQLLQQLLLQERLLAAIRAGDGAPTGLYHIALKQVTVFQSNDPVHPVSNQRIMRSYQQTGTQFPV